MFEKLSTGNSPRIGPFYPVAVARLNDFPVDELFSVPVTYLDGRNDSRSTPPAQFPHM